MYLSLCNSNNDYNLYITIATLEIRVRFAKVQEHSLMSPFCKRIEGLCIKYTVSEWSYFASKLFIGYHAGKQKRTLQASYLHTHGLVYDLIPNLVTLGNIVRICSELKKLFESNAPCKQVNNIWCIIIYCNHRQI